jgi:hypothetical protein
LERKSLIGKESAMHAEFLGKTGLCTSRLYFAAGLPAPLPPYAHKLWKAMCASTATQRQVFDCFEKSSARIIFGQPYGLE